MLNCHSNLLRLIDFDDSKDFQILINMKNVSKVNNIEIIENTQIIINTTINKARIISNNINQMYMNDQSINKYEIEINDIEDKNKTEKCINIFQLLLTSIGKQIDINENKKHLFTLIMEQLDENYKNDKNENKNTDEAWNQYVTFWKQYE